MDSDSSSEKAFQKWLRGSCLYRCSLCEIELTSSLAFWRHGGATHGLDVKTFQTLNPSYVVRKSVFECQLCAESVTHDEGKVIGT